MGYEWGRRETVLTLSKIEFLKKIQKMPDDEIIALLAFANSLESVKQTFNTTTIHESSE